MLLIVSLISWVLILIGCVFILSGGIGLIRMPDFYTRLHAASVTDTGGAIFVMLGLFLQALFVYGSWLIAVKVLVVLFFTLITSPTASHALAKSALLTGLVPLDETGKPILNSAKEAQQLARSRPKAN